MVYPSSLSSLADLEQGSGSESPGGDQDTGYKIEDTLDMICGTGYRIQNIVYSRHDLWYRIQSPKLKNEKF